MRSPVTHFSKNGYAYSTRNSTAGSTTAGMKTFHMNVCPAQVVSTDGISRSAPSRKPTYQSGWASVTTWSARYGP